MTTETSIYEYAKQGLSHGEDRIAIWFYGRSITYGELFEKIDNVADHLYELGVREGTVVTIHLPNCPQAVMAIYAVAKLGGICNMVFSGLTIEAINTIMSFTQSSVLISHMQRNENGINIKVNVSDYSNELPTQEAHANSNVTGIDFQTLESKCKVKGIYQSPESLAKECAIYLHSSGTTGFPKTVQHSHSAMNRIVANTFSFLRCEDFTDQIVLGELPLFHGFGLIDNLHDVISGGGCLVQMLRWDAELAAKWIDEYKITFMAGVPKIYMDLLKQTHFNGDSLVHCYIGGEPVDPALKRAFNNRMKRDSLLYEGYGLAEVIAYCCSCGPFNDNVESSGSAMPGVSIAVMNEGTPQFFGEGELIVASDTIMLGYYPVDDGCFIYWNNNRWIDTGDYVCINPDGQMRFVERKKNIIIRNGYNIFPSEIEAIARSVDTVQDICVISERQQGKTRILAFVEAQEDETVQTELFCRWKNRLPTYSIPDEIRFIQSIPRSSTGKIDRLSLERLI